MEPDKVLLVEALPKEGEAMMSASIDTKTGENDCGQEDNLTMSLLEALPKEGETILSAPTDTETETNISSQENSGKMSNDEALPKESETTKPGSTDTQTETNDCGPEPEKGHVHVPYINKESLTSHRFTVPEHSASRNVSSDDLEVAHNDHSREVFGLDSPTETQELKPDESNFLLQQGMQVLETTGVMKSHIDEGLVCETQVSEPITAVNKALEDKPLAGKSEEHFLKEMGEKNLDKNKPSTSVSYVQQKPPDVYVRKNFTCDNSMVDEDEELREHWTRTLQTRTSTGEVVEEIVRVLKHQKTHDLLCPVCGSCITKRVVLRKRKRSSLISVDSGYQYHSEEDADRVQGSSSEIMDMEAEQESLQESSVPAASDESTRDTVAYGCLACFSLFFKKGHRLRSQTEGAAERDTISCLPFFFPPYPWGMNRRRKSSTDDQKDNRGRTEDEKLVEQDICLESRSETKTDAGTVTVLEKYNLGKSPPEDVGAMVPQQPSVHLDKNSAVLNASLQPVLEKHNLGKSPPEDLGAMVPQQPSVYLDQNASVVGKPPTKSLPSLPSTGFSLLQDLPEKSTLHTRPSTGFSLLQDLVASAPRWQIASFFRPGGKDTKDDLTKPLLEKPPEPKGSETEETSSESLESPLKIRKPSDDGSQLAPSVPAMPALDVIIDEKIHLHLKEPLKDTKDETVIQVQPSEYTQSVPEVGPAGATLGAVATTQPAEGWDILRSIVYGGLEISIASLGVTSSAAGGDAITRTVVYLGLATLLSGLFGFYHNVLNLYYYYQEQFTTTVGKTLLLHGTIALVSYILFGALSSVTYGFSFRESNNRDRKFALCCAITFVSVFFLSLGKAHVTNKLYLKTVSAYIAGGFLAAIIGYLAGDHISELLESWGL